jgi:hypothetical protein
MDKVDSLSLDQIQFLWGPTKTYNQERKARAQASSTEVAKGRKTRNPLNHSTKQKIRKNTFTYEKIPQINESTTPTTKRRPKYTPRKGGGVTHPYVNTNPINKRNPKNAPPRSDSAQKRAPKQRIPTQLHRGGHASERENTAPQRKEPENAPGSTPFIPKGAP